MARYFSNSKIISAFVADSVSAAIHRRGYAAASSQGAVSGSGAVRNNVMMKKVAEESNKTKTTSWLTLKRLQNAPSFPIIKAQNSADFVPDAKFYKVEAILRPWRIQQVSSALLKMGICGVTVSDVRGFGAQGGLTERQAGSEDTFVAKVKMEIVVSKDQVEGVIAKIIEEARTGKIGDGKIFLIPISGVIRVRTGERGEKAERMVEEHPESRTRRLFRYFTLLFLLFSLAKHHSG